MKEGFFIAQPNALMLICLSKKEATQRSVVGGAAVVVKFHT